MNKLIYVFSEKDKSLMEEWEYHLLYSDDVKHIYVFLNEPDKHTLNHPAFDFAFSDVLPF